MNSTTLDQLLTGAKTALSRHDYIHALEHLLELFNHTPQNADIAFSIATTYRQTGNLKQAAQWLRTTIDLRPDFFAAYCNLGAAEQALGNLTAATAALEKALQLNPSSVEALCNCASVYRQSGRGSDALSCYEKAVTLHPDLPFPRIGYAETAASLGHNNEAAAMLTAGLARKPADVDLLCAAGLFYHSVDDAPRAKDFFLAALKTDPTLAAAHYGLGTIMREWNKLDEAILCYRNALRSNPADVNTLVNIGETCQKAGLIDASEEYFREAVRHDPSCRPARHNLLVSMTYNSSHTSRELLSAHLDWGRTRMATAAVQPVSPGTNGRIRIGVCSPDFCNHPAAAFLLPMFQHRNKKDFELFCYSQDKFTDATTAHFRNLADHWTAIDNLDDDAAAELIRNDRIDILIDTAGHFKGNRLEMLALRVAPVQIGGIGYPGPTGCPGIDYRISDRCIDPPGTGYPDRPLLLPDCFCCYQPPGNLPPVTPLPALRNGFITFGSLHTTARLNRATVELWSSVLRDLSDSRLAVFRDTLTPSTIGRLAGMFDEYGISADRISFSAAIPQQGHLHLYSGIDVLLDTTPWSGHTTACESLVMGVPVITVPGDRHAGRMVTGVLHAAGLDSWIAPSAAAFSETACKHIASISDLADLRITLRDKILSSPLCDGASYMRSLETIYRSLLNR